MARYGGTLIYADKTLIQIQKTNIEALPGGQPTSKPFQAGNQHRTKRCGKRMEANELQRTTRTILSCW